MYTRISSGRSDFESAWEPWYTGNLAEYGSQYATVHVLAERGMLWKMFDNPHLAPMFEALGIKREAAFGCALDFLVNLQPSVRSRFTHVHRALRPWAAPTAGARMLRVGIQIRTGRWASMKGDGYV
jgi:hypothetical protein